MAVDAARIEFRAPVARSQAEAFRGLAPVSPDYANLPILDGFNWHERLAPIDAGRWYLVVFRSVRRPDVDVELLTAADDLAHDDAMRRPGFLHYFKGTPNGRGECLSFCVWTHQAAAQHAGQRPAHAAAMRLAADMYVSYVLERYHLRKAAGGPLAVEQVDWGVGQESTAEPPQAAAAQPRDVHGVPSGRD